MASVQVQICMVVLYPQVIPLPAVALALREGNGLQRSRALEAVLSKIVRAVLSPPAVCRNQRWIGFLKSLRGFVLP